MILVCDIFNGTFVFITLNAKTLIVKLIGKTCFQFKN